MKLFIWNDRNYRLIEERGEYDEENFCIVRKLFVRYILPTTANPLVEIGRVFKTFGEVEKVDILQQQPSSQGGGNQNTTAHQCYEAYVQFKQSADAYKALQFLQKIGFFPINMVQVVPADTWHQPEYKRHDKAIDMILGHNCNSTKKEINSLDELTEVMGQHGSVFLDLKLEPGTTLHDVRQQLLGVKAHIGHLKISLCEGFDTDEEEDCVHRNEFFRRLFEVIGKNAAGPKLQELTISGFAGLSKGMLTSLALALKPLKSLTFFARACNMLYLMHTFCPKLERLRLFSREWQTGGDDTIIQSWPTLKILVINGVLNADGGPDNGQRLGQFLSLNPQIEILDMGLSVNNSLLTTIVKGSGELEELHINRNTIEGIDKVLKDSFQLKRLMCIVIKTVALLTCHFESLLACIECFSNMEHLQMAKLVQNYVVGEGRLIIVRDFPTTYHNGCECHGRAVTFDDHIEPIQLPEDKRSLLLAVLVARDLITTDDTLEARILAMFKASEKFYPNVHKTIIIPEDDRFVFLHVASTL